MEGEQFKTLFTPEAIQARIKQLGKQITQDYRGQEITALCVLKGAFIFTADLVRAIDLTVYCEFMRVSSYGEGKVSSGNVKVLLDIDPRQVKGKHVLLVEDIVDTGNSIVFMKQHLAQYQPASVKVCALLFKEAKLEHPLQVEYVGFKIDPLFVIGYGLDLAEKYRNLPAVLVHV